MTDDLPTLVAVSRSGPRERRLCCPRCGGEVVLRLGRLWCAPDRGICDWSGERLIELAAEIVTPNQEAGG